MIGHELKAEFQSRHQRLPDYVVACVGGGSNAIGIISAFLEQESVKLVGVEPAGKGLDSGEHGAVLARGTPGVLHGMKSMLLQDGDGQIHETYSIAAALDYPAVGPEHVFLKSTGRAQYEVVTDAEALEALYDLCCCEGIIPALESAHALAYVKRLAFKVPEQTMILVNLSGRGDKVLEQVMAHDRSL